MLTRSDYSDGHNIGEEIVRDESKFGSRMFLDVEPSPQFNRSRTSDPAAG